MTPQVEEIAKVLVGTSKLRYEEVRERLIETWGYAAFRDMQNEAFRVILSDHALRLSDDR